MTAAVEHRRARFRRPSLAVVIGVGLAVFGLRIGLIPLNNNSLFTHLAVGRHILDSGSVPTHDIFSFTAPDQAWVVQSWLAAVIYAVADEIAPGHGILAVNTVLTVGLAALVWRLTRPAGTLVPRLGVAAATIAVGSATWVERPLLFGLVALAAVVLVTEEPRIPPWLLVPVGWLWVNTHGSWPLGLVFLVVRAGGRAVEQGRWPTAVELRPLGALVAGSLFGAVNPLGPRLLIFPLELLQRHDVLNVIVEWQAPAFRSAAERLFLLELVVAVLFLTRRSGRWADAAVVAVFGAAALLSARNIAVANVVLVPVLARGLADLGSLRTDVRPRWGAVAAGALASVGVLMVALSARQAPFELGAYPVRLLGYAEAHDLSQRMASRDIVGNLRGLVADDGDRVVFIDDRYDMWPKAVVDDLRTLMVGGPEWAEVLAKWEIDAVLWENSEPIISVLAADPSWRIEATDGQWVLAVPRPTAATGPG